LIWNGTSWLGPVCHFLLRISCRSLPDLRYCLCMKEAHFNQNTCVRVILFKEKLFDEVPMTTLKHLEFPKKGEIMHPDPEHFTIQKILVRIIKNFACNCGLKCTFHLFTLGQNWWVVPGGPLGGSHSCKNPRIPHLGAWPLAVNLSNTCAQKQLDLHS